MKSILVLSSAIALAAAADIFIIVGGPDSETDPSFTFDPQRVDAVIGDTVFFNFTNGNHTATESTFAVPCLPAHQSNSTINGFDSGFRPTSNGTATSILAVPILRENFGRPFWFYDATPDACGLGAVGVINNDESSNETLAGFVRNAQRLNGSEADAETTTTGTRTSALPTDTTSASNAALDVLRRVDVMYTAPLAVAAFVLTLF